MNDRYAKMKAAFEKQQSNRGMAAIYEGDGHYKHPATQREWENWQDAWQAAIEADNECKGEDSEAAFEYWYTKGDGKTLTRNFHAEVALAAQSAWHGALEWQAATDAAKATGTAGKPVAWQFEENTHPDRRSGGGIWERKVEHTFRPESFIAGSVRNVRPLVYAEATRQPAPVVAMQHPDDIAVDKFAAAMKVKMALSRAKGRGGWDDPEECDVEDLACMLVRHVEKGDPVDVGNFCMMIWNRVRDNGPDTHAPIVEAFLSYARDATQPAPATLPPVVGVSRDAKSPGMTGMLVTFARPLSDGQLRELHEYLNRSQP